MQVTQPVAYLTNIAPRYKQRQWEKVVELREARAYATAVSMTDGSMWIMGGMGVNGSASLLGLKR